MTKGQKVSYNFYGNPETATIVRLANGIAWLDNGRWMHETSLTPHICKDCGGQCDRILNGMRQSLGIEVTA